MTAAQVFVSYASEDVSSAEAVCSALEAAGLACWIAPRDVSAGSDYAAQIVEAIGSVRVMVVVLSAAANASPHVRREVERAVSTDVALLPVRIEDVAPSASLEYFVASTQWIDAVAGPLGSHLPAVVDAAQQVLATSRPVLVPFPPLLSRPGDLPFVGRTAELSAIAGAAVESATGRGGLILVGGEPGVGKTRVVAEAASRLYSTGATVLAGGCLAQVLRPFQPFTEALGGFAATAPETVLVDALGSDGVILAPLVPEIGRRLGDAVAGHPVGDDRSPFFDAVAAVLGRLASARPVVLVLDDLQWADRSGLELLVHLLRTSATSVLVLGTYRDTEVGEDHPLVAASDELDRAGVLWRITLRGLDRAAVDQIVRDAHLPPTLTAPVYEQTDGNALFVREIALGLAALARDGAPELSRLPVPDGVRAVIRQRLRSLARGADTTLLAAAVIGRTFDASLLSAVVGSDVLDDLEHGVQARLVEELGPGEFRFTHDLVRDALLGELSLTRRAALHRSVAGALEAQVSTGTRDADPTVLAGLAAHWMETGDAEGRARGAAWATRAGDGACRMLAFDLAREHYEHALSLLGDGGALGPRSDAELGLALVARRAGDVATAVQHFDRAALLARAAGDVERLARVAVEQTGYFPGVMSVDMATARTALLEARDNLPDGDSGLRARVLACLSWTSPVEDADRLSTEAVDMARRTGDLSALANALHAREQCVTTSLPATLDERLQIIREAEQVELAAGEWELYVSVRFAYVDDACLRGDVEGVRRHSQDLRRFSDQHRWAYGQAFADLIDGGTALAEGDIEHAEALAQRALDVGAGVRNAEYQYAALLFRMRHEQRRLEELAPLFELIPEGFIDLSVAVYRAVLLAETQPREAAGPVVEDIVAAVFDAMTMPGERGSSLTTLAESVASVAGSDTVRRVRDHLRGFAGTWQGNFGISWIGPVDLSLAQLSRRLGELEEAAHHVGHALDALEGRALDLLTARARVERARIAARTGDIAGAAVEASEVRSWAQDRGLVRTVLLGDAVLTGLRSPEAGA